MCKTESSLPQIRAFGLDYVARLQTSAALIQGVSNDLIIINKNKSVSDIFRELVDFVITRRSGILLKRGSVTNNVKDTFYLSSTF